MILVVVWCICVECVACFCVWCLVCVCGEFVFFLKLCVVLWLCDCVRVF